MPDDRPVSSKAAPAGPEPDDHHHLDESGPGHEHEHPHPHEHGPDDVGIPPLLRAARGTYGLAISTELALAGYDDLPRNSAYVIGGLARGAPAESLVRQLGVSPPAAGQLVDTLVVRGYLARRVDPQDRRRVVVELTPRGAAAAEAIGEGVRRIDAELARMCSPDQLAGLRAGLVALCDIRERMEGEAEAEMTPLE